MTTTANVTNVNNYIKQPPVGIVRQAVVFIILYDYHSLSDKYYLVEHLDILMYFYFVAANCVRNNV